MNQTKADELQERLSLEPIVSDKDALYRIAHDAISALREAQAETALMEKQRLVDVEEHRKLHVAYVEAQAEIERLRADYALALKSHAALRHHRAEPRLGEQAAPTSERHQWAAKVATLHQAIERALEYDLQRVMRRSDVRKLLLAVGRKPEEMDRAGPFDCAEPWRWGVFDGDEVMHIRTTKAAAERVAMRHETVGPLFRASHQAPQGAYDKCDVCLGEPLLSGASCVCGGRGTIWATAAGLREELYLANLRIKDLERVSPQGAAPPVSSSPPIAASALPDVVIGGAVALLPCPFCGGVARMCDRAIGDYPFWVVCGPCDSAGPRSDTRTGAAERWNRRAQPQHPVTEDHDTRAPAGKDPVKVLDGSTPDGASSDSGSTPGSCLLSPPAPDRREAVGWYSKKAGAFADNETFTHSDIGRGFDWVPVYASPKPESETVALLREYRISLQEAVDYSRMNIMGEPLTASRIRTEDFERKLRRVDAAITTKEQKDLGRERDGSKS